MHMFVRTCLGFSQGLRLSCLLTEGVGRFANQAGGKGLDVGDAFVWEHSSCEPRPIFLVSRKDMDPRKCGL